MLDLRIAQLLELGYCFSVAPECRRQNGSRLNFAVAERRSEGGIRCTLRRRNAALCTNPFALIGSWRIVGLRAICCFGSLFILAQGCCFSEKNGDTLRLCRQFLLDRV